MFGANRRGRARRVPRVLCQPPLQLDVLGLQPLQPRRQQLDRFGLASNQREQLLARQLLQARHRRRSPHQDPQVTHPGTSASRNLNSHAAVSTLSARHTIVDPCPATPPGSPESTPHPAPGDPTAARRAFSPHSTSKTETRSPRRSARPRTSHDAHRQTPSARRTNVYFPSEKSRRQSQNLLRPPKLPQLTLQLRDPCVLVRHRAQCPFTRRTMPPQILLHPVPQRLRVHPELLGNPGDRSTPRPQLALQLTHHRHRAFLQLHRVLARRCRALDPFQNQRPPTNPEGCASLTPVLVGGTRGGGPGLGQVGARTGACVLDLADAAELAAAPCLASRVKRSTRRN